MAPLPSRNETRMSMANVLSENGAQRTKIMQEKFELERQRLAAAVLRDNAMAERQSQVENDRIELEKEKFNFDKVKYEKDTKKKFIMECIDKKMTPDEIEKYWKLMEM